MAEHPDELARVAAGTQAVYRRHARAWDEGRPRTLYERPWLDRLLDPVPAGGSVLDLGCGAGDPIGGHILSRGLRLTGLDGSPDMLDIARRRFPQARWIEGDMRDLDLAERFDAIVGWDSFFHLRPGDQRRLMPRLAEHLAPGGGLMLTVGPAAGEALGSVAGEPVYHSSLSPDDYAARLAACGVRVVAFVPDDPTCAGRSVLLARRG